MRRFLPFAALLGVALVLGCQDVGTGPDGLVPQFDRKGTGDCAPPEDNVHCHDDEEPPTGEGLHIAVCCSQNRFSGNAAQLIALGLTGGTYRTLKAKQFNEMTPAQLAETYDVLIFFWKTSDNVNADWQRLLDYMDDGGGIIFEDPNNVEDLAAGVSILAGSGSGPVTVTIAPIDGLTTGTVPNPFDDNPPEYTFTNNHIRFAKDNPAEELKPFLTLTIGTDVWTVGLYGEFGNNGGRIVLTGLDNGWHGRLERSIEQENAYNLLFNEICWVMGDELSVGQVLCQN